MSEHWSGLLEKSPIPTDEGVSKASLIQVDSAKGGYTLDPVPSGPNRTAIQELISMGSPIHKMWGKLEKNALVDSFILAKMGDYWVLIRGRATSKGRRNTEIDCYSSKDPQLLIREFQKTEKMDYEEIPGSIGTHIYAQKSLNLGVCKLGSAIMSWQMMLKEARDKTGIASQCSLSLLSELFPGNRWITANDGQGPDEVLTKASSIDPISNFEKSEEAPERIAKLHSMEMMASQLKRPSIELLILYHEDCSEISHKLDFEKRIRGRIAIGDRRRAFDVLIDSVEKRSCSLAWAEELSQRTGIDNFPFSEDERNLANKEIRYKVIQAIGSDMELDPDRQLRVTCELTCVARSQDELNLWEEHHGKGVPENLHRFFPEWRKNKDIDFWQLSRNLFDSSERRAVVGAAITNEVPLRPNELRGLVDLIPDFMASDADWEFDYGLTSRTISGAAKAEKDGAIDLVRKINKVQSKDGESGLDLIAQRLVVLFKSYKPPVDKKGYERKTLEKRSPKGTLGLQYLIGDKYAAEEIARDLHDFPDLLAVTTISGKDRVKWINQLSSDEFYSTVQNRSGLIKFMKSVIEKNMVILSFTSSHPKAICSEEKLSGMSLFERRFEHSRLLSKPELVDRLRYHKNTVAELSLYASVTALVLSIVWTIEAYSGEIPDISYFIDLGYLLEPSPENAQWGIAAILSACLTSYAIFKMKLKIKENQKVWWNKLTNKEEISATTSQRSWRR